MDLKLVVASGKLAGKLVPIPGPKFVIGRAADCQLRPNSDQIAPHHCEVAIEEGRVLLRDLQSEHGTVVNGQKILSCELKNGDRVRVGPLDFEVQMTVALGGKKKPKISSIAEAAARMVEKSSGDDLDVSNWLSQTDSVVNETIQAAPPAEEEKPAAAAAVTPPGKKKSLFAEGAGHQPTAGNSSDAAEDLLKRMFGG